MDHPRVAWLALSRWLGTSLTPSSANPAWATPAGSTIALRGRYALKLQSRRLRRSARAVLAEIERDASMRLAEGQRVIISLLWLNTRSAHLRESRDVHHLEPALLMRRLDPGGIREKVARNSFRAVKVAGDFGAVLAGFHGRSPIVRTRTAVAEREAEDLSIAKRWLERHGRYLALQHAPHRMIGRVVQRAERLLDASRLLLSARARAGCRIDGHGDLHVDNLQFLDGKATLLDVQPHRRYRVNDVACDLGRLAFELHRLFGERARRCAIHAYEGHAASVPAPLVSYFEAKSLLVDLAVLSKYRAQGRPQPQRAAELLDDLPSLCARILALPQR